MPALADLALGAGHLSAVEFDAEVGQHAVVQTGIVQLHGQGVFEVDAAADRLGGLPVRQVEQELQHTDGGQLGGREARAPVARVPVDEVLVAPQPVQPVSRTHIAVVPRGLLARAIRAVSSGLPLQSGDEPTPDHLGGMIDFPSPR
ncbi:hypothetical protein GCM10012275_59250 [Longimycelium tulufanense]|uniref:Uncharacterized protein n=1 Tax=Longimycelium tulufanense TaxID=907463 RepID=A0A8J3CI53_9PSEU|nr:hypothetical protein GCM10012275_59250 [Longimycelium tulufanense]